VNEKKYRLSYIHIHKDFSLGIRMSKNQQIMILRNPAVMWDSFFRIMLSAVLFCFIRSMLPAQGVMGNVVEEFSRQPIAHAEVSISFGDSVAYKGKTDEKGLYAFTINSAGRIVINIKAQGYVDNQMTDVLLDGYSIEHVEHFLVKTAFDLPGITVVASWQEATSFIRTISPDDMLQVAGNFEDPVRIAHSQPGIVLLNDQANHLSARGQSPIFNSWYLEGLEIVNPSHTSNAGTLSDLPTQYGGGVNMFSAQTLGSTDIYIGVNPLRVNSNTGAAIDMHLHESSKPEWRAKAGLLGLELGGGAALGKQSILDFNLRYSFTGILTSLGADFGGEKINFYDGVVSFRNEGALHKLKLFAWAGRSINEFDHVEPPEDRESDKDFYDIDYSNNILGAGGRYDVTLNPSLFLRSGFAYSTNSSTHSKTGPFGGNVNTFNTYNILDITTGFVEFSILHSSRFHSDAGIGFTHKEYENVVRETALRPYLNTSLKFAPKWEIDLGGELQYTFRDKEWFPGYRFQVNWNAIGTNTFFTGIRHSASSPFVNEQSIQNLLVYVVSNTTEMGWKLRKSQYELAVNVYYQEMKRLVSYYLDENDFEHLADYPNSDHAGPFGSNSTGVSRHFGIEGRWHYKTSNGWKLNFNQSVYKSVRGIEGTALETGRYNGKYGTHFSISKEIIASSEEKNKLWNFSLRGILNGGLWEPEINVNQQPGPGYYIPVIYDQQLPAYKRIDVGITRTIAFAKVRWRYSLDIQNAFGFTNIAYHYYDAFLKEVVPQEQLGIIPVLSVQASW
jgi:hypothetical protein